MNETFPSAAADAQLPGSAAAAAPLAAPAAGAPSIGAPVTAAPVGKAWWLASALALLLGVAGSGLAVYGQQRIKQLEQELVRRQQDSQGQAIEARAFAQQAQDIARAAESKIGLLEGRVAEAALQRSQLEDLIQQMSRSRDENVLADIDAALRVADQQSTLTGSAEPLAAALRHAEERLARLNQPRLERVRRAVAHDIDRVKSMAVIDLASLTIKLDEATRSIDDLPLAASPRRRETPTRGAAARAAAAASAASAPVAAPSQPVMAPPPAWQSWLGERWLGLGGRAWDEVRRLLRVTRIAHPEAMLAAPEQTWFLRENLKLRLLNARLALLSRQYDTAQSDLRDARDVLVRYFDPEARSVVATSELLQQAAAQARQVSLPRPEETLAAVAALQAGR